MRQRDAAFFEENFALMKNLIINADDFGLTAGVCDGIVRAYRDGIVTSTTVLINAPHLESSLEKLKSCPLLDVGLHLNITWGKPILPASNVKSLIGDNGLFSRKKDFERIDPDEVEEEWRAQIAKARGLGLLLTHLDSHHHAHLHPLLLDLFPDIAREEHLAVRSPATWARDFLKGNRIPTPDNFISDFYGEGKTTLEHLQDLLRFALDGFTEVMCHPAVVDEELKAISTYGSHRGDELETLTRPEWKEWLAENGFTLSGFKNIPIPVMASDRSCELILPGDQAAE